MTMQARERLIYEGQERRILGLPLSDCNRPVPPGGGLSTACYRGYLGVWEFRDDALHLVRLESDIMDDRDRLTEMFPEAAGSVEAVWFSGELVADDLTDPKDVERIERVTSYGWPVHFVAFTIVVRLGKLLLETVTDLKAGVTRSRLTRHAEALYPGAEFEFLRTIQADPNDITAKLVYADWLEDRADLRGPLLREEAAKQEREGPLPPRVGFGDKWSVPTARVPAENTVWFWRRLAGIPEPTPEELRHQEFLREFNAKG